MRYTGEATMEERALRDVERWKDKIEVRLDNRQVFFLFFGSALVACLLFILGVVVGKRLESRGRAATPDVEDPLALLDRVAAMPPADDEGLTFPKALIRGGQGAGDPGKKSAVITKTKATVALAEPAVQPKGTVSANEGAAPARNVGTQAEKAAPAPETPPVTHPAPTPKVTPASKPAAVEKLAEKAATVPSASAAAPAPGKGKFALQIGAFQSRDEAEAFAARFGSESPYIVQSEVPGKGLWYRVRLGNYDDNQTAMAAKTDFERRHKMIAYVAPR